MSTLQPLPAPNYLNNGDTNALNELLSQIEAEMIINMLREFLRGWLASTYIEGKEVAERADLYFTFERMLDFAQTLHQNNLAAINTLRNSSMSSAQLPSNTALPHPLTPAHLAAFSELFQSMEAEEIVQTLENLFRGWMQSEFVPDKPFPRGDFFHQYETILQCFQALRQAG